MPCIFCSTADNLNAQMTLTLDDGSKVSVQLCDSHAEDATIKTAKTAYLDKQRQIDELREKAKALGLDIGPLNQISSLTTQGSLLVPHLNNNQQVPAKERVLPPALADELVGDMVISTELLDSRQGMVSVGGTAQLGRQAVPVTSHTSYNNKDKDGNPLIPEDVRKGKARMQMVEGRSGTQIAIPEIRVDGLGTTRLRITKKETDANLQARFKRMAQDGIDHDKHPYFARSGYENTQSVCSMCHGQQTVKTKSAGVIRDVTCPKCNGAGFTSVY